MSKSESENWTNVISKLGERRRKEREKRIVEWASAAGPPHAEVLLGDDPEYMDRIGFWRVPGGLIRVRASKRGEFDPMERIDITDQEVNAIIIASEHSMVIGEEESK